MAETLHYIGITLDLGSRGLTFSDAIAEESVYQSDECTFPARARVMAGAAGRGTATWTALPLNALGSVLVGKVYGSATAQYRLATTANVYYWDGAAWSLATLAAHWNTGAEVAANITAWTHQSLGLVASLGEGDYTYGLRAIVGIRWARATGTPLRAGGYLDELIYRTIIPWLKTTVPGIWLSRQVIQAAITASVSFDLGEQNITVLDAVAFNSTADPELLTPLGTYDSGTKVLTLVPSLAAGVVRVDRFKAQVPVVYGGSRDLYYDATPFIAIREVSESSRARKGGQFEIADIASGYSYSLQSPAEVAYSFDVLMVAEGEEYRGALSQAVKAAISETNLESPSTGQRVDLMISEQESIDVDDNVRTGRMRITVTGWHEWQGTATTYKHLLESGITLGVESI